MAMVDVGHHGVVGRRFNFHHITDDDCAKTLGFTKKPQLMQFRDLVSPTPAIYEGEWHPIYIMKWLWAATTPSVFEFSQETYELTYYQDLPQIILFRMLDWDDKEDYEATFEEVASKNKGDYLFVTSGLSEQIQQQLGSMLGVEYKDLPTIRIIDLQSGLKYKYPNDVNKLTRKSLQNFLDDFEDLQLKPYFRSAPVPSNPWKNNVLQIVGDTQMDIVHNKSQDVFVFYTAPWCQECK